MSIIRYDAPGAVRVIFPHLHISVNGYMHVIPLQRDAVSHVVSINGGADIAVDGDSIAKYGINSSNPLKCITGRIYDVHMQCAAAVVDDDFLISIRIQRCVGISRVGISDMEGHVLPMEIIGQMVIVSCNLCIRKICPVLFLVPYDATGIGSICDAGLPRHQRSQYHQGKRDFSGCSMCFPLHFFFFSE